MIIVVIGAGRMGAGLAVAYAAGGHDVALVDQDRSALDAARERIARASAFLAEQGLAAEAAATAAPARVRCSTDAIEACAMADIVQEAIPEDLDAKRALLASIEPALSRDALVATNTSSLRLADISAGMRDPTRLIGMHWVSPPYLVPLVEVVRDTGTPQALVDRAVAVLTGLGKVPIVVPDVPGFALNRLQFALFAGAVDLVDQGIVTPEQVDLIIRTAMAPRQLAFGQFRLFDLIVNGRTVEAVSDYLFRETGGPRYRPSPRLAEMVEAGRLGLVSGEGWFRYPGDPAVHERQRDAALARAYRFLAELDGGEAAAGIPGGQPEPPAESSAP